MTRPRKLQDYMKTIYQFRKNGEVRNVDLALALGVKKPTVSVTLKALESEGYITRNDNLTIELTEKGEEVAEETIEVYELLYSLLLDMGVPEELAAADAHQMEHVVSKETSHYIRMGMQKRAEQAS